MTTEAPFARSCAKLDDLIRGLEDQLGVEHWDVKAAATSAAGAAGGKGKGKGKGGDGAGAGGGKKGGDGGKKGGKAAAPAGPNQDDLPPIQRLDIRVGHILEAVKHPDADSLYLEKIDVGEAEPRQVISGLAGKIPLEEMQGRWVVTLCNLKPANMRGIKSHAMVFCGSAEDGTVELLEPPAGSKPGELITIEGLPALTPDEVLNPKKKIWEAVCPDLKTDDDCVGTFQGKKFSTSAGLCKCKTLKGAAIK